MALETELKYRVSGAQALDAVLQDPQVLALREAGGSEIRMESLYYDTQGRALTARKWTLRERRENGLRVVTVKKPGVVRGGLHTRGEWQCDGQDVRTALPELVRLGAPAELLELTRNAPLTVLCGASFTRRTVPLRFADGSTAELCADLGILSGGGREAPLCELELELEGGEADRMLAFAGGLARRHALAPEPKSKFVRALETAGKAK